MLRAIINLFSCFLQVLVEPHPPHDYFEVPPSEDDHLLTTVDNDSGETTIVITTPSNSEACSMSKSSYSGDFSAKKPSTASGASGYSSSDISKKTMLTNLSSGTKSDLELCVQLLSDSAKDNTENNATINTNNIQLKKKRLSL